MGRYPKNARDAVIKCIPCNAPGTRTIGGGIVCVKCGGRLCDGGTVRQGEHD